MSGLAPASASSPPPLLSVRNLSIAVEGAGGQTVVDRVSFDLGEGGVLGIVGESGCGKSVTAMSVLRLNNPALRLRGGEILLAGEDLLRASEARIRAVRGGEVGMIFQEPMTSLNPVLAVGDQIVEAILAHRPIGARAAREAAIELLGLVGIPLPARRVASYPHQLSGGMRQRVMIAMALSCRPRLLIADEPTTALDVTIQAQIIDLLRRLQRELGMAVMIITHDLGLIADFAADVVVMYAGKVVERGATRDLFRQPLHPYTERLLASIPPLDRDVDRLTTIPGTVPSARTMPSGCRFSTRCPLAEARCRETEPPLRTMPGGRAVACHLVAEGRAA
ncbi:MAG: ABC transporter ATP-binding protein [Alphaproteobacteria bacterium]|nr:ABC transporter ATP-binding protein [Alphaproteobacteria bacterium]